MRGGKLSINMKNLGKIGLFTGIWESVVTELRFEKRSFKIQENVESADLYTVAVGSLRYVCLF